jgi:threonine synthase
MAHGAKGSALSHLECPKCHARSNADVVAQLCACGSPLLARYDLERVASSTSRDEIDARTDTLWRWSELLPVRDTANRVSLGERATPIVALTGYGARAGIVSLAVKDEGTLPTGSFKARGAAIGISRARELGVRAFALPTNGNAGAAWSAYGRRAGMEAFFAMPKSAPPIHRFECQAVGAHVTLVDGLISDAGKLVAQWVRERGLYDASTLKEPYRIEGKKTLGFEIVQQNGWSVPDVILYPTGGGVGLIGIDKALAELRALGWIGERKPRMVVVQASGCAPIVRAWEAKERASIMWEGARTAAFGINVPKALGDFLVLEAVYSSDGFAIAVDDKAIVAARDAVASDDGMLLGLEGAATIAAAKVLRESGWIAAGERVLAINTGSAFKGWMTPPGPLD